MRQSYDQTELEQVHEALETSLDPTHNAPGNAMHCDVISFWNHIDGKIKKFNQPLTLFKLLLEDLMHSEVGDVEASPAGDDPSQEEDHRD